MDVTVGISLVGAAIAAVGAPGVTFWVMKRMTANFVQQNQEHCVHCRTNIESQIADIKAQEKFILERQARLRESEIPSLRAECAMKCDVEKSTAEIKVGLAQLGKCVKDDMKDLSDKVSADVRRVHERVDFYRDGRKPHV